MLSSSGPAGRNPGERTQVSTKQEKFMKVYATKKHLDGPSSQYSRTRVPNVIQGMVLGTRNLRFWVLGISGAP